MWTMRLATHSVLRDTFADVMDRWAFPMMVFAHRYLDAVDEAREQEREARNG